MNKFKKSKKFYSSDSGQTIVETVIAIFILSSGITAALGLAIYVFSNSQNITKQIIAVGLAREGIEAVKNMRDTNWLKGTISKDCYNPESLVSSPETPTCPSSSGTGACCYKDWRNESNNGYNIDPGGSGGPPSAAASATYRLRFDSSNHFWDLEPATASCPGSGSTPCVGLNFDSDISHDSGFYTFPDDVGVLSTQATSEFSREIIIAEDNGQALYGSGPDNPFNKDGTGYRLKVTAHVWWADKKCPRINTWPGLGNCSVELQTYLTNWKNY